MLMFKTVFEINGERKVVINSTEEKKNHSIAVAKEKGYKVLQSTKLYPVASWERNQHVFYNAVDRATNRVYEARETGVGIEEAEDWLDKCNRALSVFDFGPKDSRGVVYAEYNDYKFMKDVIGGYAARHNGYV